MVRSYGLRGLEQFRDAVSATGRLGDGGRKCFIRKKRVFEIQ